MAFDRSSEPDGTARRGLYPDIEPYRTGMLDVGDGHSLYWELVGNAARQAGGLSCMAGPAPAAPPSTGGCSTPRATMSCCSTSAAAAARSRMPAWRPTPPGISSPTWSGCGARSRGRPAGSSSAGPGARPWRSPMPRPIPTRVSALDPARHLHPAPPGARLVLPRAAPPTSFPTNGRPSSRTCRPMRVDDPILTYHRRLTGDDARRAPRRGAGLERLGGRDLDADAGGAGDGHAEEQLRPRLCPHREPLLRAWRLVRGGRTAAQGRPAALASPGSSSRAATTWSARRSPPGSCPSAGPRRSFSSPRIPAIPSPSRARCIA